MSGGRLVVVGTVALEDGPGLVGPSFGPHGHEGAAALDLALIVPRLVLGDAQTDEGTDQTADGGAACGADEGCRQWPSGENGPDDRDDAERDAERREGGDAGPHRRAGRGAGPHLAPFRFYLVLAALADEADVVPGEASVAERHDRLPR